VIAQEYFRRQTKRNTDRKWTEISALSNEINIMNGNYQFDYNNRSFKSVR
jgi:hypothetical protein